MQCIALPDVHAYEARNSYWPGQILKTVSGASLYGTTHITHPWGITIYCNAKGNPHSVEFENGTLWSFCAMSDRLLNTEWPMFAKDYAAGGGWRAYVERMFTDSMHLTLTSENACFNDVLIWHYPPCGGRNGLKE